MALKSAKKADPTQWGTNKKFFNRELSWLKFNERVLDEALAKETKVLERLKFLSIFVTNLDEFFMVRVAGLNRALAESLSLTDSPDRASPNQVKEAVARKTRELFSKAYRALEEVVFPDLATNKIFIKTHEQLTDDQKFRLEEHFYEQVYPVLTPLAVDPAHPFPFLSNLSLYLLVVFESGIDGYATPPIAFVEVPEVLPRLIPIPGSIDEFILLESIIASHLDSLFLGYHIKSSSSVRVTRDLDFTLLENDVVDLLKSVQNSVKQREQSDAVRLEYNELPENILEILKAKLNIKDDDLYCLDGPLNLSVYGNLYDLNLVDGKVTTFNPRLPPQMRANKDIFSIIRDSDLLLHHPYESFYAVIEFINLASTDPDVLAIKQTLYRTSGDSPIIDALIHAAENGKHVTAVVELKARFDEHNNIVWARRMETAGVNVVFGFIGLKTHGKTTLIVRKEKTTMQMYVHLSTGNYNSSTAKNYVDLGLITANQDIGKDISTFFNLLTGFNIFSHDSAYSKWVIPEFSTITIAPLNLRERFLALIDREIENALAHKEARIFAKMNALVDAEIIDHLYEASNNGVKIDLIVRGICCLKPGIPGLSENITVKSIVDRFLEHSRIYYFYADGDENTFLSSADWMPRNMDRRVEILFPILDKSCKARIKNEIIATYLADNVKARILGSDGLYSEPNPGNNPIKAQERFITAARESGVKSIPYDLAIQVNRAKMTSRPVAKKVAAKSVPKLRGPKK